MWFLSSSDFTYQFSCRISDLEPPLLFLNLLILQGLAGIPSWPVACFPYSMKGAPYISMTEELMYTRKLGILGLLVLFAAGKCTAQVRGDDYRGHGYGYVAPGGLTAGGSTLKSLAFGGGGEAISSARRTNGNSFPS
jgi:hypothetical protein